MELIAKLFLILSLFGCSREPITPPETPPNLEVELSYSLGMSFPPMANDEQRRFTAPLLEELNVGRIRIGENWSFREPIEGEFNWGPLDDRISWAEANDIEILLTIQSNGPDWACSDRRNSKSCVYTDNAQFQNYIEQLLKRYPNQIDKIQFGNEWQTEFWYIGTEEEFVEASNIVYSAIQELSPETEFVLGGFTTISLRFLAGCNGLVDEFYDDEGNLYDKEFLRDHCDDPEIQEVKDRIDFVLENALYDIVDIHLYDDAHQWLDYYENIQAMVSKPILVSEFGGPNVNIEPTDETYQAAQLEKYILAIDSMEVEEAYFFKLVEGGDNPAHAKSGLIDDQTQDKKESFEVFKALSN